MRNSPFWWVLIGAMVVLDIYVFQAIRFVTLSSSGRTRTIIFTSYWIVSGLALLVLLALPFIHLHHQVKGLRATIFAIVMGLFFAKLVAALFLFVDDARRGVTWLVKRFTSNRAPGELLDEGEKISRSVFLSWMGMI